MCDKCRFLRRPLPEVAPRTALVHVPHLEVSRVGGVPLAFHGKRLVERPHWAVAAVSSRDGGGILWVSEPVTGRVRRTSDGIKATSATSGVVREIAYSPDTGWRNVWVANFVEAAGGPAQYSYQPLNKMEIAQLFVKIPELTPKTYAVVAVHSTDKPLADLDLLRRYSVHPKVSIAEVQGVAERRSRRFPGYTFAVVEVLGTICTKTQTKTTTTKSWEK